MIIRRLPKVIFAILLLALATHAYSKAPYLSPSQIDNPPPKIIRTCCGFGADIGYVGIPFSKRNDITSIDVIGPHKYMDGRDENNGIVYTHRGGFLDLGHLRDCADWTAYIYNLIQVSKEDSTLTTIRLGTEGGTKKLQLNIPDNICDDEAANLAAKIAYDISVWHEISTWFGAAYVPLIPERYSSFSPEDIYSNLLGTQLAVQAILSDMEYDEAMTFYIDKMLNDLHVVSSWEETFDAFENVNKLWYDGDKRFPNKKVIIKRYLNWETELQPWLIPEDENVYEPYILSKPYQSFSDLFELQIRLNYRFPVKSIFGETDERIITQEDFPELVRYIQNDLNKMKQKKEYREIKSEQRKDRVQNAKILINI
ncbi:MAG: DUF4056 domain-containing protein [Prolixibacteraceae bacterium]|nr:DUF4056 domain-containing protein [Prolixibacteraceae bacterium]